MTKTLFQKIYLKMSKHEMTQMASELCAAHSKTQSIALTYWLHTQTLIRPHSVPLYQRMKVGVSMIFQYH